MRNTCCMDPTTNQTFFQQFAARGQAESPTSRFVNRGICGPLEASKSLRGTFDCQRQMQGHRKQPNNDYLDPTSMYNNCHLGCVDWLWAFVLHIVGVQVVTSHCLDVYTKMYQQRFHQTVLSKLTCGACAESFSAGFERAFCLLSLPSIGRRP